MDIKELESFLNYQPFFDQDPQVILENILQKAKEYLPAEQVALIPKAYLYAAEKHK
jgi:hypothetical protein